MQTIKEKRDKKKEQNETRLQLIYENYFVILESLTKSMILLGIDPLPFYRMYVKRAEAEQQKVLNLIEKGQTSTH